MAVPFNAEDLFDIGIKIEKNGKEFYERASALISESIVKDLFSELAEWEGKHIELFEKMKSELPETARKDSLYDPEGEAASYIEAAADSHVFIKSADVSSITARCSTPTEALETALSFEKDSVIFFVTMRKVVSDHLGREKIDLIIDEELKHIAMLNSRKNKTAGA